LTEKDIDGYLRRYGVPLRFRKYPFALPDFMRPFLDTKERGIALTGGVGAGNTTAIVSFIREWIKKQEYKYAGQFMDSWKFIVYPEFIMALQDCYKNDKGEMTALEYLDSIARYPFLAIDDMGAEKPTEYVRQATYYLINYREMRLLPTFITSNFSMDFLNDNIDPRISSRISGMCEVVRFDGKDKRISNQEKHPVIG
jgi:DNA replication protein DnaC